MDRNEQINPHSKVKLQIYKSYLEAYLSIMCNIPHIKDIFIVEPFAGKGIANNTEVGSALISKQVIEKTDSKTKHIFLILNDKQFASDLEKNIKPDGNYIKVYNQDANTFIQKVLNNSKMTTCHKLFFIDPWGYTQLNKETYNQLFSNNFLDIIIFIPIYHIYRFLRKEINAQQLKPIANFLSHIGIDEKVVQECSNEQDFILKILEALKRRAKTDFVYYKIIKNTTYNSEYALFFISKNILGAEKFLEALEKVKEQDLFQSTISDEDDNFIELLRVNSPLDNTEIYEIGIKNAYLPKRINIILRELENKKEIKISECSNRKRGSFYIAYRYYKDKAKKLTIDFYNKNV